MGSERRISDVERRSRLISRHHLEGRAPGVLEALRSLTVLHSTDPATPYLSLRARVPAFETKDLDHAILADRSVWRLHAMRRTLFIVPADEGAVFLAGASQSVASQERRRLETWIAGGSSRPAAKELLERVEAGVMGALGPGIERSTRELTADLPELGTEVVLGSGKWSVRSSIASRVLLLMAMDGSILRTGAAGSWRSSQYRWAAARHWFSPGVLPVDEGVARVAIVHRYLRAHGPATVDDVRWWTGWTARAVQQSLSGIDLEPVEFEDGSLAFLLADDAAPVPPPDPTTIAFLPALDPTPMGWRGRRWYIGDHGPQLFDRNGNVGPTIWAGGRVIGLWTQRKDASVVVRLLEDPGDEVGALIAREAAVVQKWLDGVVVRPRFRTPAEKELAGD